MSKALNLVIKSKSRTKAREQAEITYGKPELDCRRSLKHGIVTARGDRNGHVSGYKDWAREPST